MSVIDDMAKALKGTSQTRDAEGADGRDEAVTESVNPTIERSEQASQTPEVVKRHEPGMAGPATLEPSAPIGRLNTWAVQFAHSKLLMALDVQKPSRPSPPLRRIRSLPECWRISAFIVFDKPAPPPSPSPAPKPKPKAKAKMYQQGAAITSVESLAPPLQSGRSYLRSLNPLKTKTKTRPATPTFEPETVAPYKGVPLKRTQTGSSMKTTVLRKFRHRENTREEELPAAPKPVEKLLNQVSKLTKTTAQRMRVLVKATPNARELSWKDFLKIMSELGFKCEPMDGTTFKFYYLDGNYPVITFSRRTCLLYNCIYNPTNSSL
ncbi:hypothetical protein C8R44DRAFT_817033 [Mycena epipterygia]|nr:hypothetical protein C8R44DRAFT_817033 [Mycena epipterygia]